MRMIAHVLFVLALAACSGQDRSPCFASYG